MNFAENYSSDISQVTREFYFNIGSERVAVYAFLFVSLAFLAFSLFRRIRLWRKGKPELRSDRPLRRIMMVIKYALLQVKILKDKSGGLMHGAIFFGFISLVIVTAILTVQEDITRPFFDHVFINGNLYLFWSLFADITGILVLLGLAIAVIRRYLIRPDRLDTKGTDSFAIIALLLVVATGFLAEGLRIAITDMPSFEVWSPVGYGIAALFHGIERETLETIHYADWWVHMAGSFTFIALLGTGKLGHVFISTLNIFFMNLENENNETKSTLTLINPEEFETAETFGVSQPHEYTWKQLMDSDACTRCGRCQDLCPAYLTEKPLSPKKLVQDIKYNMDSNMGSSEAEDEALPLIDGSVSSDEFWSCTNCGACMESCPVAIEHVQKMIDLRRYKVLMEGDMASELQTTFQNMETNFNPYGFAFGERAAWLDDPDLAELNVSLMSENSDVDYLYFVGSAASYDKRNQKVAAALLKILSAAGYRIGILGSEEADSGDAALRGGNEYLFHALASQNLETFGAYNVKKVICTCPHDYNVLKKEYRKFADMGYDSTGQKLTYDFQVFHHTEIISDLIKTKAITLKQDISEAVTYHDSCFLGRYNGLYNEPRFILQSISGIQLKEMSHCRDKSFCCGAGGARMFIEEHLGTRVNQYRTAEAKETGATMISTACPFCMTMLSDGITELEIEDMKVLDIAELVCNAMGK